jgi:hypothetical protein
MLLSFVGCMIILAGTYGQFRTQNGGRVVVFTTMPNGTPVITTVSRRLLTAQEVHELSQPPSCPNTTDTADTSPSSESREINMTDNNEEENSCAVCIDDLDGLDPSLLTVLPCGHHFHTDCILPWLTERQSKCPLCKFDVLEYVRGGAVLSTSTEAAGNAAAALGSSESLLSSMESCLHHSASQAHLSL